MNWDTDEKIEYFLHSLKAESLCPQVRKVYNICRSSPFGKVIDPGLCAIHAQALIGCFEEARDIYPPCSHEFSVAKNCIKQGTEALVNFNSCETEVENYKKCFHPLSNKYSEYEGQFRTS